MPKFLKFILNIFAVITALGYLFILLTTSFDLIMGVHARGIVLWLIATILIAAHRVPIMLGEFLLVRPYLNGNNVIKELFKINIYVIFSLFLSSILCTLYGLRRLHAILQVNHWTSSAQWQWQYITLGIIVLIMGLVAVAEVYIKADYFTEKHLTTNPKKLITTLSAIIVPVYILWVVGLAFYVMFWILLPRT